MNEVENLSQKLQPLVVLTGISGSGKDFLLRALMCRKPTVKAVNFGELMHSKALELAADRRLPTRDDLRNALTNTEAADLARAVIDEIVQGDVQQVVNTHLVYKQNGLLVFNYDNCIQLKPRGFLFVKAEPEQIQSWRMSGVDRVRDADTIDFVTFHQNLALAATRQLAEAIGSPMRVIENGVNNTTRNVDEMSNFLDYVYS